MELSPVEVLAHGPEEEADGGLVSVELVPDGVLLGTTRRPVTPPAACLPCEGTSA